MSKFVRITRDVDQPPGGWVYTVKETGLVVRAATARGIKSKVRAHLHANDLEIPEPWDEWFEDSLCKQMNLGGPYCNQVVKTPQSGMFEFMNLHTIERFLKTMIGLLKNRELVSQEEADRRARICVEGPDGNGCPNNVKIGGCLSCYAIRSSLKTLLRGKETEAKPESCKACGCHLGAKVWIPSDVIDKAEEDHQIDYPEWCWRRSDLE